MLWYIYEISIVFAKYKKIDEYAPSIKEISLKFTKIFSSIISETEQSSVKDCQTSINVTLKYFLKNIEIWPILIMYILLQLPRLEWSMTHCKNREAYIDLDSIDNEHKLYVYLNQGS